MTQFIGQAYMVMDGWSPIYARDIMQEPGSSMYMATHKILFLYFLSKMVKNFSLDLFLQKGIESTSGKSVCLSSFQDFEYRPFISSQDYAWPHISYTAG